MFVNVNWAHLDIECDVPFIWMLKLEALDWNALKEKQRKVTSSVSEDEMTMKGKLDSAKRTNKC